MTFEECHSILAAIRLKQGTRCPLVRIDYGGTVFRGRVARADSDPDRRKESASPYGVLVLESLGLCRIPETILQIANFPPGGVKELDEG
jgi:hypothetical protein